MTELYDTINPKGWGRTESFEPQPDALDTKHGDELLSHFLFYGATREELERLDKEQVQLLEVAGFLESVE